MTNGLAVRPQTAVQPGAPASKTPRWLQYLAAAYPNAQVTAMTYLVYEDQFVDVDQGIMYQVARAVVKSHKFASFPTLAELHQELEYHQRRAALENRRSVGDLAARRHELLERAYRGDVVQPEWQELINDYRLTKRTSGAENLERRLWQFVGGVE